MPLSVACCPGSAAELVLCFPLRFRLDGSLGMKHRQRTPQFQLSDVHVTRSRASSIETEIEWIDHESDV